MSFLLDDGELPKPKFSLETSPYYCEPIIMNTTKSVRPLKPATVVLSSRTHKSPGFTGTRDITNTDPSAAKAVLRSIEEFDIEFEQLKDLYGPLLWEAGTPVKKKQVLLLWFNHTQLFQTLKHTEQVTSIYQGLIESKVDSKTYNLRPHLLDEFVYDANFFKVLETMAEDCTSALESLLDIIKAGLEGEGVGSQKFDVIAADLRALSSDLRRRSREMPNLLAHHLKFLEIQRGMQESNVLWMLSVLASIFLPLSLASGILSMQTRLKDLHDLLYDFCGVVILLLTLVVLFLLLAKASKMASAWNAKRKSGVGKGGAQFIITLVIVSVWSVILASFIVGMVKDIRVGGPVLGYGFAAIVGLFVFLIIAVNLSQHLKLMLELYF
ncbi:hypothetical protein Daus18300_004657 [Diaporthe australafricana]|uniref:Uncharacterized protein n=1 Tax=Diaporthe australafricana TaxID=127596 RepID=A0ABR3X7K4_9PEZI